MVLMQLFPGQQWSYRHKKTDLRARGWGAVSKERVGSMERVTWKLTLVYVK